MAVGLTLVNSGLQLLTQIIIADITTLKWRGFVSSLISLPYIINSFVGSNISTAVIKGAGWRWGCMFLFILECVPVLMHPVDGMFTILIPVAVLPLIITLLWAENKARKPGVIAAARNGEIAGPKPLFKRIIKATDQLDVPGLLLVGASVAFVLLPLTLSKSAAGGWSDRTFC